MQIFLFLQCYLLLLHDMVLLKLAEISYFMNRAFLVNFSIARVEFFRKFQSGFTNFLIIFKKFLGLGLPDLPSNCSSLLPTLPTPIRLLA